MDRQGSLLSADQATFYLGPENDVQRVVADGNVNTDTKMTPAARAKASSDVEASQEMLGRAEHAELFLTEEHNLLRTAILTGNVHVEQTGSQPMQGDAGRVVLDYSGQNELQKVHALDGAHITQQAAASEKPGAGSAPQRFEITAPVIDFTIAAGHLLEKAVTSGAAKIQIDSAPDSVTQAKATGQRTVVTAGKFDARFTEVDGRSRLQTVHGAPNAKIVNSNSGELDRVSTSETVDAILLPQGGLESVTQQGNVAYSDGQPPEKRTLAWANTGLYTPADQMLVLTGNPRVINGGMETTAKAIRINRATTDALADGDVKSTYSELKEQPNGALLASSSPIHATARSMTAHNNSGVAVYTGNARLWQDANIVEAPSIEFDRNRRFVLAQGTSTQPVQTILTQTAKAEQPSQAAPQKAATKSPGSGLIVITAAKLTYTDAERKVHYEGGVNAKGDDFTADAQTADAFLVGNSQSTGAKSFAGPSRLDHMNAENNVVVRQPNRRADGQKLVYTTADDKFVLTGGSSKELPSIFDAEQGKITGVSLTFYRTDDRVLVEGAKNTPVVTQTRVAR